jgi:uncharacterized protein (TIGR02996 family)
MFAVFVSHPDSPGLRRFAYPGPEIAIGSIERNDLILAEDGIEKRHARVVQKDRKMIVVDLKTWSGTYVNGRRLTSPLVIRETDTVMIGGYTLAFQDLAVDTLDAHEPYAASDPTEASLLQAIADRDETIRLVYADWLEQRGDLVRAEFLRVQDELLEMAPGDAEFAGHASRLGALAAQIDVAWRVRVASPAVERCGLRFDFQCPMEWSMLRTTERDGVRHCTGCQQDVYYALSVGEARSHARDGHCVALDVTSARWCDDLAEPFAERVCEQCKMDIGHSYRGPGCPQCGYVVARTMMVGRLS